MKLQVFLLLTAFFITSCKKEEIKVEKKPAETNVITTSPKAEVPKTEENATPKTFSNTRFREVKAVKINSSQIKLKFIIFNFFSESYEKFKIRGVMAIICTFKKISVVTCPQKNFNFLIVLFI